MTQTQELAKSVHEAENQSKEAKKLLEMLMALANTKADLFLQKMEMELQNTNSDSYRKLPITRIIDQKTFIHEVTQDNVDVGKALFLIYQYRI